MTKRKMLLCAAALVVAVGVAMLFNKPTDAPKSEAAVGVSTTAKLPVVAATTAKPSVTPAVSCTNQTPTVRGTLPYVLTSAKPIQKSLRLAVEAMGARTVCSISRNELLIEATPEVRARLAADSRFEEVAEFVSSSKVQPELAAMIAGGAKSVDVSLVAISDADRELVISCLEQGGGEMLQGCINEGDTIRAKLPADLVATLATRGDVRWMETFVRPQFLNDLAVSNETMNVVSVWDMSRGLGLTGAGQAVSTSDTGIDTGDTETMHKDLRNRVKDIQVVSGCYDYDKNGHGTHTAGSIVGDGTESGGQIKGTAYNADLYAWFCSGTDGYVWTPDTLSELFLNGGAWTNYIHSASWGSGYSEYAEYNMCGKYSTECAEKDDFVWKNPEYLPVFSAGNDGTYGTKTIASPASAKNVLAVGATQNTRKGHDGGWGNGDPTETAMFSSRGPCLDGRTKPDIAAPGVGILSTRSRFADYSYGVHSNTNYAYDSGTSMSCPLTAGAVALVRQWLVEKKGFVDEDGKRPTAALMKAVIMGGAKGAAVPNNDQGWGRVDLANTLAPTNGCAVKLIDRIPFDEGFVTNIVIETTNAAPLDVQLVWIDCPGSASGSQSAPRLVNDLDLIVSARIPGEPTVRYGNGGNEPDTLNNAESVRIENAIPNKYVITVDCKTILHDYTEGGAAALYIRGAFDPSAEVEEPAYVHLKKQNKNFISLDRALTAVKDDEETVEILDWVNLDSSVTLTNSCTIVATNADASASYVARPTGASLTIATNAVVSLTNVVFAVSTKPFAAVKNGGCLKLGSHVDLGIDEYHLAISTADAGGFELAAALTRPLFMHCDSAAHVDEVFGSYSCDDAVAENCAANIVCADDMNRVARGRADTATRKLVWQEVGPTALPMSEASGYFIKEGKDWKYARLDKGFEEFAKAVGLGETSRFIVRKNGRFDIAFSNLTKGIEICGEGMPQPVVTAAGTSGFRIYEGGSLAVSNLVFTGYVTPLSGGAFIEVNGGDLTLDHGAMLDGIVGRVDYASGVVDLYLGTMTMRDGSAIVNCEAQGNVSGTGNGGAIYTSYDNGCVLNLQGGTISNCYASTYGGGLYVDDWNGACADVSLSSNLTIAANLSGNFAFDDIYLASAEVLPHFMLVGEFSGSSEIGVRYSGSAAFGNAEGEAFMSNTIGTVSRDTLDAFFNDTDASLEAVTNANGMLVWAKRIVDGQCRPGEPVVTLLIDADGKTNRYVSVARAFEYMGTNSPYVVEMQTNDCLMSSVGVPAGRDVTLRSAADVDAQLVRGGDFGITVPACTSLTLTNIVMRRDESVATGPVLNALVTVEGGVLTLASGVCISNILGSSSREAAAIAVYDGGTITMLSGSRIYGCQNTNNYDMVFKDGTNYGCGGGVLVDNGTAHFKGGEIAKCLATRGGGAYVCNTSKAYVSGDIRIVDNEWLDTNGVHHAGNVFVADQASVYLDGELIGGIHTRGLPWITRDTNLVAEVSYVWTNEVQTLAESAAKFVHDASGDKGVAVTNGTDALIVWCGAVKSGVYTNASDGVEYRPIADVSAAVLLPPLDSEAAIAAELAKLADATVAEKIKTLTEYEDFCSWAANVGGGKAAVATSGKAYVSYEFGTTVLLTNDPTVEITEVENAAGGLTVSVVVKDGDDPVAVASDKVKEMFEAAGDVDDWNAKLDLTVSDLTQSNANEVRFTVKPAGNPAKAFIRLKY